MFEHRSSVTHAYAEQRGVITLRKKKKPVCALIIFVEILTLRYDALYVTLAVKKNNHPTMDDAQYISLIINNNDRYFLLKCMCHKNTAFHLN